MNEHIRKGNEAVAKGDYETAKSEFYLASDDPNPLTQRIVRNRLAELFPEAPEKVYASTQATLYHRLSCPAKNMIKSRHYIQFKDSIEAENRGYEPCDQCKPHGYRPVITSQAHPR